MEISVELMWHTPQNALKFWGTVNAVAEDVLGNLKCLKILKET